MKVVIKGRRICHIMGKNVSDDTEGYSNRLCGAERQKGLPGRMGQPSMEDLMCLERR